METSVKELTLAMVTPILKLSKLQIRAALAPINGTWFEKNPDEVLPEMGFMALLLADLLERIPFLKPEQRSEIFRQMFAANLEAVSQLAFADGNWCTWSGQTGWLDLETGDLVQAVPAPPVETIGYNLGALQQRALQEIAKRKDRHASQHSAGSVEEPGDVR
jgi:hypothetical protein